MFFSVLTLIEPFLVPTGKNPNSQEPSNVKSREKTADYWYDVAQNFLEKAKQKKPNTSEYQKFINSSYYST